MRCIMMLLLALMAFVLGFNGAYYSCSLRLASSRHLSLGHVTTTDITDGNLIDRREFFIERVSTKARALDVRVFRGFSVSAAEYISEQHNIGIEVSVGMAVDHLMKNYDEHGHYIRKNNENIKLIEDDPEDYFIALYTGTEALCNSSLSRQNGIAGLVSAQFRRQPPLIVGPSQDGTPSILMLSPTIPIPSHFYIANMRVDSSMQRRGIGIALLSSIKDYVKTFSEDKIPLVLSVDSDNTGAIHLYEKFGFKYLEKNSDWGTMILM